MDDIDATETSAGAFAEALRWEAIAAAMTLPGDIGRAHAIRETNWWLDYYRKQRSTFPTKRDGTLTESGKSQAFNYCIGFSIGYDLAKGVEPSQNPALFLLQVRGADGFLNLTDKGEAQEQK